MSEAIQKKAAALLKRIKKAEDALGRTKIPSAWTSDADLKRIKPEDRAAKKKELEERVADLNAQYRKLEMNSRTHGGRRTRRSRTITGKKGGVLPPVPYPDHQDEASDDSLLKLRELQKGTVHGPVPGQKPAIIARGTGAKAARALSAIIKKNAEEHGGTRRRRHRTRSTRRR